MFLQLVWQSQFMTITQLKGFPVSTFLIILSLLVEAYSQESFYPLLPCILVSLSSDFQTVLETVFKRIEVRRKHHLSVVFT